MEAVGAGAGVVAFITLALKSTKTIYETASSIRNGPVEIEHLASEVCRLQSVLTQLSKLPDIGRAEPGLDLETFSLFSSLLEICHKDVSRFAEECKKVHVQPEDKRVGLAWKKIKAVLKETEFRRMRQVVSGYVTELGFHLSMIQSNTGSICKEKLIHLNEAMSERAGNDRTHRAQANSNLSVIQDNVKELNHTSLAIEGQLRDTLAPLVQKIHHIPEMSAMQSENICVLLKALQDQVSGISAQISHSEQIPYHKAPNSDIARKINDNVDPEKDNELLQSIERLCHLAKQKEGTVSDKEAEIITDDLNALLDSVCMQSSHAQREARISKKRSIDLVNPESNIDGRDVKRMRGLLTSSDCVVVNKAARPFPIFRNSKTKGRHKMEEIQTAHGKILMSTKRRQWCAAPTSSQKGTTSDQENATEFTGKITAIFDQFQAHLTIKFHQRVMASGYLSLYPSISAGMTLPDDSPIFSIVEDGDMNGLLSLLSQGKASLRDRNSLGIPLLRFAVCQPEICNFLIDNGADVDEIAPCFSGDPSRTFETALSGVVFDCDLDEKEFGPIKECRRLLLNAGADPTIGLDGRGPITSGLHYNKAETLELFLDLGKSFIDFADKNLQGDSLLLESARNDEFSPGYDSEMFAVLLSRGSNIHDRNSYTGDTCLHICIQSASYPRDFSEKESLVFLVKMGADVNACNYSGESVSENAYQYRRSNWRDLGGYHGDLWDVVLSECGYDIAEMRKGFPRRPRYTRWYTREDFERLWGDREELCPYYHDPPIWWPSEIEELKSSEEDSEQEELLEKQDSLRNAVTAEPRACLDDGRPLGVWGNLDGNGEDCQERKSESAELERHFGSSTKCEEGSPAETVSINFLPPLRANREATMAAQRPWLPPLSSIYTTPGASAIEPASPWQHSGWSSQMAPIIWRGVDQTYPHSSISGSTPTTLQDWRTATQTTESEHSLPAEPRSEEYYELEPNPWL